MNSVDYSNPVTRRTAANPTFHLPVEADPERAEYGATPPQRAEYGVAKADTVVREAKSSGVGFGRAAVHFPAYSQPGISSRDVAAVVVGAIMMLGPLLGGYITNMHS